MEKGKQYFKSRQMSKEIGDLSSKEIGQTLFRMSKKKIGITIERHSYSLGTTWKVQKVIRL